MCEWPQEGLSGHAFSWFLPVSSKLDLAKVTVPVTDPNTLGPGLGVSVRPRAHRSFHARPLGWFAEWWVTRRCVI